MSKFLTGEELINTVDSIIWDAQKTLLIVSPYIKLDSHFKKLFEHHLNRPDLHIVVVFGKNENKVERSMSKGDFDFFKRFPKVSIIYVPNLHAKYYGNEKKGVITSINLYDFSFKNNVEFGVFAEQTRFSNPLAAADLEAWEECTKIAFNNQVVFARRPLLQKKKKLFASGYDYLKSENLCDLTESFYGTGKRIIDSGKRLGDFDEEIKTDELRRPEREVEINIPVDEQPSSPATGYCIRTGEEIPFNPERPLTAKAYQLWKRYKNPNYKEKFCHYSGEASNGNTSVANPILEKNQVYIKSK